LQCPRCSHENGVEARYCEACGSALSRICTGCGAALSVQARFCPHCGTAAAASGAQSSTPEPAVAERRQLTVLFCDLVGATQLSSRLDPEEYREVVRTYQEVCIRTVTRYEGHIAQYLGDGVLVYFGWPQAHEDDAQRGVRAALDLVAAVAELRPAGERISVRTGVHTGLVVVGKVGDGTTAEQLALGDTPNIAARIQGIAEPDQVVASAATEKLLRNRFESVTLGPQTFKGVTQPMDCHRIVSAKAVEGNQPATALVGRDQELGLMLDRWERALEGQGQVILLSGEPGIGKSRLVQALRDRLEGSEHFAVELRCSPYFTHTPLYPVIEALPRMLRWRENADADAQAHSLEQLCQSLSLAADEAVPLLAQVLSRPIPPGYGLPPMSPDRQRRRTLETLIAIFVGMSSQQPLLLAIEDLHWLDPTTLELLSQMIEQVPTRRILLLVSARPEFVPGWGSRSYFTALSLNRLTRRQTEQVVSGLTGGKQLPAALAQQIVDRTDGVPLFIEELIKAVLASGMVEQFGESYRLIDPTGVTAIPATLQDSLMARLDRMESAKQVAQLGATIGRTFRFSWLRAVSSLTDSTLQQALRQLVEAEVLFQRGSPPDASYLFKHALIQDAAYNSLLKVTRQQHHRRIAHALVETFPDFARKQPEVVAHHLGHAGDSEAAIRQWEQASRLAMQRSAHPECVAHLLAALALIPNLPSPAKEHREADLRLALGFAYIPISGWAAPESVPSFQRALALCGEVGNEAKRFRALFGLNLIHSVRGQHSVALEFAERALEIAEKGSDPEALPYAHHVAGWSLTWMGRFPEAIAHFGKALAGADAVDSPEHRAFYGFDIKGVAQRWLAYALMAAGYLDESRKLAAEMRARCVSLGDPHNFVACSDLFCWMQTDLRDWEGAVRISEEQIRLCELEGRSFAFFASAARKSRGEALLNLGHAAEGIDVVRAHLRDFDLFGAHSSRPRSYANLAVALATLGRREEALEHIAQAKRRCDTQDERYWEACIHWSEGDVCRLITPPDEVRAEGAYRRGIDVARAQQAKLFELQASLKLAQLLVKQGRRREALDILSPIYAWFTQGFDTRDLREAKALLEELRA